MTAPSPTDLAGTPTSHTIMANGTALDSTYQVVSIDVWLGVNKLPQARLVITDGSPAEANFPISETTSLIPGATLEISLGYAQQDSLVFSGVIYRQGIEIQQHGPSRLVAEATDKAMVMTLARKNAIFETITDSALITKLISGAGLSADVASTSTSQPSIVQYYATDWDLMLIRAQLNSMVAIVAGGKVTVAVPDTSQPPVLTLTYGQSILDFRAAMDAATQFTAASIQSVAWDPATQAITQSGQASTSVTAPGNLSSDDLAKVFNVAQYAQQTGGSLVQADLTAWSSAELLKSRLAKIRGEVKFLGCALAKPGVMVTLAGLGDRFNGAGYVAGLHHHSSNGLWTTQVEIGMPAQWFAAAAPFVAAPGASGQLPPVSNLQTGLVVKTADDPDGEFRVQVKFPLLQTGDLAIWARLGNFYASNAFGAEFYPEVGDEVVVAFMNDDPRFPVILCSLYSKKNPPPVTPDAKNNQKTLMTRSQLRIDFYEDLPAFEIITPAGQSVRLDDKAKTVTLKDANGNTLTMAGGGITLDSASDIKLTAKGDISLTAQGNVNVKATANVALKGAAIKADADSNFAAQGAAGAKLSSGAMVTIQGAMVKIN